MKRIKIPLVTLLLVGALAGCKKENLDIIPTNIFEASRAFVSVGDLEQGLLGAYASYSAENTMYINGLLSDELKISNENRGQGQFEYKFQYNSGTNSFGYNAFYVTVNRANRVLEAMPGVVTNNAIDEATKNGIKAEALALRAYAHFELLQRFAPSYNPSALGVTYIDYVFINDKLARQTVAENLGKIEQDLAAARAGTIPNSPFITTGFGNIRLSKAVVAGMQARVALYKRDWANAATFATDAITLAAKPLATGQDFKNIWLDASDSEVMLRFRRIGTGTGTLFQDVNGDVFFEPSEKVKQLFNRTTDVRFDAYFLVGNIAGDTALIRKFYTSSRGPKIVDPKFMRTAEMYLIRAEARAEQNDLAGAAADINTLRAARIAGYTNVSFPGKDEAITNILNERFKELAFEGFRYFDLKRRNLPVTRLASDVQSTQWISLPANDFKFTLPIPQTELFANPNATQNPGY